MNLFGDFDEFGVIVGVGDVSQRRHGVGGGDLLVGVELADAQQQEDGDHTGDDEHQQEHGQSADEAGHRQADAVGVQVAQVLHHHRLVLIGVQRESHVARGHHLIKKKKKRKHKKSLFKDQGSLSE